MAMPIDKTKQVQEWLKGTNQFNKPHDGLISPDNTPRPSPSLYTTTSSSSFDPNMAIPADRSRNRKTLLHSSKSNELHGGIKHTLEVFNVFPYQSLSTPSSPCDKGRANDSSKLTPSFNSTGNIVQNDGDFVHSHVQSSEEEKELSQRCLTEKDLTLVSLAVGCKLPLLTCELGLSLSDWDYACKNFRLSDTQALYILRIWYSKEERNMQQLVTALVNVGLATAAMKLKSGQLDSYVKTMPAVSIQKPMVLTSNESTASTARIKFQKRKGYSLHGDDGQCTVMMEHPTITEPNAISSNNMSPTLEVIEATELED
jgi:hypothetical protein